MPTRRTGVACALLLLLPHLGYGATPLLCLGDCRLPSKVAMFKTHKTASSTLGSVLFRWAAGRSKRVFVNGNSSAACAQMSADTCNAAHVLAPLNPSPRPADVVLHHLSHGVLEVPFSAVLEWYGKVFEGAPFTLLVPIRSPVDRLVSWWKYFETKGNWDEKQLEKWVDEGGVPRNTFAAEFGLTSQEDVEHFLQQIEAGSNGFGPHIHVLWLPLESFDEAVVLMGHHLGFSMLETMYIPINPGPSMQLSDAIRKKIEKHAGWDMAIHAAVMTRFKADLAAVASHVYERKMGAVKRMLADFDASCKSGCAEVAAFYGMSDLAYEGAVDDATFTASLPPCCTHDTLKSRYNATGRFC